MSPVFYEIHSSNLARFQDRDIFRSIPNFLMTRKIQPAKQQGQCSYAGYIGFLVSAEFKWEMENGATSTVLFSSLCTFPITPPHCITTTLNLHPTRFVCIILWKHVSLATGQKFRKFRYILTCSLTRSKKNLLLNRVRLSRTSLEACLVVETVGSQ